MPYPQAQVRVRARRVRNRFSQQSLVYLHAGRSRRRILFLAESGHYAFTLCPAVYVMAILAFTHFLCGVYAKSIVRRKTSEWPVQW